MSTAAAKLVVKVLVKDTSLCRMHARKELAMVKCNKITSLHVHSSQDPVDAHDAGYQHCTLSLPPA